MHTEILTVILYYNSKCVLHFENENRFYFKELCESEIR
jgi:hypothetical protein